MVSLKVIFLVLIFHWVLDFIFQTDKQAKGKSKNFKDLLSHTAAYSVEWLIPACFVFHCINRDLNYVLLAPIFAVITFVFHTITDYFTSRLNSKLWRAGKAHEFFISVGFDQLLHYFQLFLTFYFLSGGRL